MCFCSCWFHFSPHYYFPLLPLSFPILVPFLLLFFDFLLNSPCSCGVCPSHPFSVPSVCLICASSFTVCCWGPLGAQSRGQPGSPAPLGVPGAAWALPQGRCSTVSSVSPDVTGGCCFGVCSAGEGKTELQLLLPLWNTPSPSGRHPAPPHSWPEPFPAGQELLRSTGSRGQPRRAQQSPQPCSTNGLWPLEQMSG